MRVAVAVTLTVLLALAAVVPHVHAAPAGPEECPACVVRSGGDVARCQTPDLAPLELPAGEVALLPIRFEPSGAPLGAVPGQSPPAA